MIIWDDGSTDDTPEVLKRYGDTRIQCYRGINRGQASAMNQAVARANGKYVALLDDDDRWLPHKLVRQVEVLEMFPTADILFANFENLDVLARRTSVSFEANWDVLGQLKTRLLEPKVNLIVDGFPEAFLQRNFILPSSTIIRKRVCDATGPFNEKLKGTQDKEYWWRCALRGAQFAFNEEVLLRRIKGEDSFTASGERSRREDLKELRCCLEDARGLQRRDLIPIVERAIGLAWENMIRFYLVERKPWRALDAFRHRCGYGITGRALALAACAFFGPAILRLRGSAPKTSLPL